VYDIRAAGAEVPRGCFVKDNTQSGSKRAAMEGIRETKWAANA
jgi:hypothetical protein